MQNGLAAVLRHLARHGTATIPTLAAELCLSESSLSRLMGRLLDAGLVQALDQRNRGRGRPSQVFHLSRAVGLALGIELDATRARWVLIDILGEILKRGEVAIKAPSTNEQFLEALEFAIQAGLRESSVPAGRLSCLGFALPGFLDHETQSCISCATILGPRNVPVGTYFAERFGLPVDILEQARSVAVVESRLGAMQDAANFLTFSVARSISTGVVLDHKLYTGENHMAGQLAHIVVDPLGPRCACGAQGCVEVMASSQAIVDSVAERLQGHVFSSVLSADARLDIETIAIAAEQGDQLCYQAVNRAGELIGIGIATLSKAFGINRVVMYGQLPRLSGVFFAAVKRSIKLNVLPLVDPDITISALGPYAVAQGVALHTLTGQLILKSDDLVRNFAGQLVGAGSVAVTTGHPRLQDVP